MGRRERELDPGAGPLERFAHGLRELRREAGNPAYRDLARLASYSASALSTAASGRRVPSLAVTLAFVRACGGDPRVWLERWHELDRQLRTPAAPGETANAPQRAGISPAGSHVHGALHARPPAQLPAAARGFAGRTAQLRQLDALVPHLGTGQSATVPIIAIDGGAGIGKTALALHWAHRMTERFRDGQLFASLRGNSRLAPLRPHDVLAHFLRALGTTTHAVPTDLDEAAALYRSIVAGRSMLIVLDDASDPEQVRPLLPGSSTCAVVITSRDTLSGLVATLGARRIALDVLDAAESRSVMSDLLGHDRVAREHEAVEQLTALCAHVPLALRIAAADLARHPKRSILEHANGMHHGDRLAQLRIPGDDEAAIRAAFDASYARIEPEARALFRLLGLIPGQDFTLAAATALAGLPAEQAAATLLRLERAHLVEQRRADRFSLHDLLRLYAADLAQQDADQHSTTTALSRYSAFYIRRADAAARRLYPHMLRLDMPQELLESGSPEEFEFDDPAAAAQWLDAETPNLVALAAHAVADARYRTAWLLADVLRGFFWLRGNRSDWLAVAEAGVSAARRGGDDRATAAAALCLADAHLNAGRPAEAVASYTSARECAERAGWLQAQAAAQNNLASLHHDAGRLDLSAAAYRAALAIAQRTGRQASQASALNGLGLIELERGRYTKALTYHTQALGLWRTAGSSGNAAIALNNLCISQLALGDRAAARRSITEALAVARQISDTSREAGAHLGLALIHRDHGRLHQALDEGLRAVNLARQVNSRPVEAYALNNVATTQLRLGRTDDAQENFHRALTLTQDSHPYPRIESLIGLAVAELGLGRSHQALERATHALEQARERGFRVLEADAHSALAEIHLAASDPDRATSHARQATVLFTDCGHELGHARALRLLESASQNRDDCLA